MSGQLAVMLNQGCAPTGPRQRISVLPAPGVACQRVGFESAGKQLIAIQSGVHHSSVGLRHDCSEAASQERAISSCAMIVAPDPTGPKSRRSVHAAAVVGERIRSPTDDACEQPSSLDASKESGLRIVQFLKGKSILVTGSTGFLAKVLVEKILRSQPDVGHLYLLIQPTETGTAETRLNNVLTFVNGTRQGYSLEKSFKMGDSIAREMNPVVDAVSELHLESELALCAMSLQEVEVQMSQSTFSVNKKLQLITKKMKELGMARCVSAELLTSWNSVEWQDTYVFSKAIGEMVVGSLHGDILVVVVRPSVVESTLVEPFPGYIEGLRMLDPLVVANGKGQLAEFPGNPQGPLDVIPADLVANTFLSVTAKHAEIPGLHVYHAASGVANPLTLNEVSDAFWEHFSKDPLVDRRGAPIQAQRLRWIPNVIAYNLMMSFTYHLPLQISKYLTKVKGENASVKRQLFMQEKTLEQFGYLSKIYAPYGLYKCRFGSENTRSLMRELIDII